MLVHLSGGELAAYSQKCTHLVCVVFWEAEDQEFVCPCHEGIFDATTGAPVAGPPQRGLPQIQLDVRNDTIWAVGITR